MTWLDVSLPVRNGMVVWPGDPPPEIADISTVATDGARVSRLILGSHTGTHIDAPAHFIDGGGGVDAIPLDHLVGPCRVIDVDRAPSIARADLEPFAPQPGERLLLRTRNRDLLRRSRFDPSYVALDISAADYLVTCGVVLIGIDALSIEGFAADGHPVHVCLLSHGIAIVEGLDLHDITPGVYELIALPLRLEGLDGSPSRVLLRSQV